MGEKKCKQKSISQFNLQSNDGRWYFLRIFTIVTTKAQLAANNEAMTKFNIYVCYANCAFKWD